ncbi:MAG: hypothetical protein AB7O39_00160 [Flavobacteriaceae bacterium]
MKTSALLNRRLALRVAVAGAIGLSILLLGLFVLDVVRLVLRDSGRSTDSAPLQLIVADVPMSVPRNMIRDSVSSGARVAGIDLYFHWPTLNGYSAQSTETFRRSDADAPVVYVTITGQVPGFSPAERLTRIYSRLFQGEPLPGPDGLVGRRMKPGQGFDGDVIYYEQHAAQPYVVRCGEDDVKPAPVCQREIVPDPRLAVTYRFAKGLLPEWRNIDAAVRALVEAFVATAHARP